MKKTVYKLRCWGMKYLTAILMICVCQTANAQFQIIGNPVSCPLCNPPQKIVELRGRNYNLHEFPAMYLDEGQSLTSEYKLFRPVNLINLINNNSGKSFDDPTTVLGVQEFFDRESMYIEVASESVPNTILRANARVNTSKAVSIPQDTISLKVTAGNPGKTAVAWLVARGHTEQALDGYKSGIMAEKTFILPVVVRPSPLPLFVQEIIVNKTNPKAFTFSLKDQARNETVRLISQTCWTSYNKGTVNEHYTSNPRPEGCADLLQVYAHEFIQDIGEIELIPTKRILLIIHNDTTGEFMEYFRGNTIFRDVKKAAPASVTDPK